MGDWKKPNGIIGDVAEGKYYFKRPAVEAKIWNELDKGNYVLFNAPRRTGKSSILKYMAANSPDHLICHYENISSDNTAEKFFERLLRMVLKQMERNQVWRANASNFLKSIGVENVSATGVKFKSADDKPTNKSRLLTLLPQLKEGKEGERIVLFLDEFPDVISNVANTEGKEAACDILLTLRTLKGNSAFKDRFSLVLSGSIGLDHVVKNIDRPAVINFYRRVPLKPLSSGQPEAFVQFLTKDASIQFTKKTSQVLIKKLKKPIPYFIQLLVDACNDYLFDEERKRITSEDIDHAWEMVLQQHEHFQDWEERLKQHCKEESAFLVAILTTISHKERIDIRELYNLGVEHEHADEYKALMDDILIRDGYLQQYNDQFTFVSPLLQEWWKRRHPVLPKS